MVATLAGLFFGVVGEGRVTRRVKSRGGTTRRKRQRLNGASAVGVHEAARKEEDGGRERVCVCGERRVEGARQACVCACGEGVWGSPSRP